MSSDLLWMIVRNHHAFECKKKNIKVPFSSEPGNLKQVHRKRHNGFVNKTSLDIKPIAKGKGCVMTYKTSKNQHRPAKNYAKLNIKGMGVGPLQKVEHFFKHTRYPKHLRMLALRRTSAINRSQRAVPFISKRAKKRLAKGTKRIRRGQASAKKTE